MKYPIVFLTTLAPLLFAASASPTRRDMMKKGSILRRNGTDHAVFEHAATNTIMTFVANSGICETTPGVNQYSGYLSVGSNMSMFFWFFEARNSPTTAPLATWFNGGPGCSSMIGLFQEHGPCHFVNGSSTPSLNPYSWNNYANMLYVDQPIGVGFSYGTDAVNSTISAAPYVWKLLQAFYAQFPEYENRDFGIFTESYGGHYGPEFADYFEQQNAAIAAGTLAGENIELVALGINNGWFDPKLQFKSYIDYSYNNSYKPLITAAEYESYLNTYNTECAPALANCTGNTGTDIACISADNVCNNNIEIPLLESSDFNVYDVRTASNDPSPPETYLAYLQDPAVMAAIGAKSAYQECPDAVYEKFVDTGDDARSSLPSLSHLLLSSTSSTNLTITLWAGDADFICNWLGTLAVSNAISSDPPAFDALPLSPYTLNGVAVGTFKTAGNLGFVRVFDAGHEVPYYQPEVAEQVFRQTMGRGGLSGT